MVEKIDKMFFGEYYQDETYPTPIEWYILKKENGRMLLLSVAALEIMPYAEKWEDSKIRSWLNNGFYNVAFNDEEKRRIIDNISINNLALSISVYVADGWANNYVSEAVNTYDNPTRDKVFLPDYSDFFDGQFDLATFNKDDDTSGEYICRKTIDKWHYSENYSQSKVTKHAKSSSSKEVYRWWLRNRLAAKTYSEFDKRCFNRKDVHDGHICYNNWGGDKDPTAEETSINPEIVAGVRPCIWIKE